MTDTEQPAEVDPGPGIHRDLLPLAGPIADLHALPGNPRRGNIEAVANSLRRFGQRKPIVVRESTMTVTAGNHTLVAARDLLGWTDIARILTEDDDVTASAFALADNRTGDLGTYDDQLLAAMIEDVRRQDADLLADTGWDPDSVDALLQQLEDADAGHGGGGPTGTEIRATLAERFLVPPFSVLDARQGYWQDRKRAWLGLGIRSEEGRPANLLQMSDTALGIPSAPGSERSGAVRMAQGGKLPNKSRPATGSLLGDQEFMRRKTRWEKANGREVTSPEFQAIIDADPEAGLGRPAGKRQQSMSMPRTLSGGEDPRFYQKKTAYEKDHGPISTGDFETLLLAERAKQPNRSTPGSPSGNDPSYFWKKQEVERRLGREISNEEFEADHWLPDAYVGGTSVFDPVICELAYRWFCPPGGTVLDPFAGGSVRGIVAAWLGRDYTGIELRPEQVAANRAQAHDILSETSDGHATWLEGDSAVLLESGDSDDVPDACDFVFSCPPYYDLERYGGDDRDLSNAGTYDEFLTSYRRIIQGAADRLADDRFACFVVGDIRDPAGMYRGFVPDTIGAFEDAGLHLYNEAILVTAVGSLALRAARIFSSRKLGKTHQNVLVFVKGDPKAAVAACGEVEVADPAELFGIVLDADAIDDEEPPA